MRVVAFYLLLLLFTWPVMLVAGDAPLTYIALAVLGPSTCALVVSAATGGRTAVNALLARVIRWRAPARVWAYAGVGHGLLVAGAALVVVLVGPGDIAGDRWGSVAVTLGVNMVVLLVVPGLVEEIGWRGFCLPLVQERSGPIVASLVIGTLWAIWHLPLWVAENDGVTSALGWAVIGVIGASFIYTWLHNCAWGSVLPAIVLHASENAWTGNALRLLVGDEYGRAFVAVQVATVAIAVVVLIATRGRLGRAE